MSTHPNDLKEKYTVECIMENIMESWSYMSNKEGKPYENKCHLT